MITAWSYLVYAAAAITVTIWVGHTLKKHGAVLLARGEEKELAEALSDLLATGFYLFHVGFALLILRYGRHAGDLPDAIEVVSTRLGLVLMVLAASHFVHLAAFSRLPLKKAFAAPSAARASGPAANHREESVPAEVVK